MKSWGMSAHDHSSLGLVRGGMCEAEVQVSNKPKFRVGQVVAYRAEDGSWEYDRIAELRPAAEKEWNETAWLKQQTTRIETRHLRALTKREAGQS
jgi:hypothetical protein